MLDFIALYFVAKKVGEVAERNGRKPGGYRLLTVLLWFVGEVVGALTALALFGEESLLVAALFGLSLAAVGAWVAALAAGQPVKPAPTSTAAEPEQG